MVVRGRHLTHRRPCLTCLRPALPLLPRHCHGGLSRRLLRRGRWHGGSREVDRSRPLHLFKASTQVSEEEWNHRLLTLCNVTRVTLILCFCFTVLTDLPPGYPYQSITAPFGSPFPPYHIPAPTGADTEVLPPHRSRSPASASPLPSVHLHSRLLDADIKPQKLETSKTGSFLKQEPGVEQPQLDVTAEPLGPLRRSCSPVLTSQTREQHEEAPKPMPQSLSLHAPSPPPQPTERLEEVQEEEKEEGQIKMEASSYSCQVAYPLPPPLTKAEPKSEVVKDPEGYSSCITADSDSLESTQMCTSLDQTASSVSEQEQTDTPISSLASAQKESVTEAPACAPPSTSNSPLPLVSGPEDPMAGMLALLTASEIARARPSTPPAPTLIPQIENAPVGADCSSAGALEMVALEGMALLSQMAQQEMEHISLEQGEQIREGGR